MFCFATCFKLGHFVAQHPCTKVLERWSDLVGGVFETCWGSVQNMLGCVQNMFEKCLKCAGEVLESGWRSVQKMLEECSKHDTEVFET